MPIAVGDLVQNQTPISVVQTTTLAEALNIMIEYDFSQLPVLDGRKKPIGMVTSTSIARALLRFGAKVEELSVSDATVRVPDFPADEDLLYILDNILQHSVVFIVDSSKALIGILTEYDTTQYFRQRTEDIVLVESIERSLKDHLLNAYDSNESESTELREAINSLSSSRDDARKRTDSCLRAYAKSKEILVVKAEIEMHVNKYFPKNSDNKSFNSLTLSEFIQLAQKNWQKLESIFNIPSSTWTKMIDEVREVRNKLVHFRGGLSPAERHRLRFCADWFTAHSVNQQGIIAAEEIGPTVDIKNSNSKLVSEAPNQEAIDKVIKVKYSDFVNLFKDLNNADRLAPTIVYLSNIQSLVKGSLPQAALSQSSWWTDVSLHSQQWLEAGWKATRAQFTTGNPYIHFNYWPSTIHPIKESWQLVFWRNYLDCTEQELKDAIKTVGPDSDLVEIHVKEEKRKHTTLLNKVSTK